MIPLYTLLVNGKWQNLELQFPCFSVNACFKICGNFSKGLEQRFPAGEQEKKKYFVNENNSY
jgi:hypothetical protein